MNRQAIHEGTGRVLSRAQTESYLKDRGLCGDEFEGNRRRRSRLSADRGRLAYRSTTIEQQPGRQKPTEMHSRLAVYVTQLGWGRCWYPDCRHSQQFLEPGAQQCEGCGKWLEVTVDALRAREEFPVHYMTSQSYSAATCECGAQVTVYGPGMKRCTSCQKCMIDVRLPRARGTTGSRNEIDTEDAINNQGDAYCPSCFEIFHFAVRVTQQLGSVTCGECGHKFKVRAR